MAGSTWKCTHLPKDRVVPGKQLLVLAPPGPASPALTCNRETNSRQDPGSQSNTFSLRPRLCSGCAFILFPFRELTADDTEILGAAEPGPWIITSRKTNWLAGTPTPHISLHKKETSFHCIWATVAFGVYVTATSITLIQTWQEWLSGSKERRLTKCLINYNALRNTVATLNI